VTVPAMAHMDSVVRNGRHAFARPVRCNRKRELRPITCYNRCLASRITVTAISHNCLDVEEREAKKQQPSRDSTEVKSAPRAHQDRESVDQLV